LAGCGKPQAASLFHLRGEGMTDRNVVELDVQLELNDFLRASYWYLFNKRRFGFFIGFSVFMLFMTVGVACFVPDAGFGLLVPLLIPLATLLMAVSTYFGAKRAMKSNKMLQQLVRYRFSPDGIDAVAPSSAGHVNWDLIREAVETKQSFLIFIAPQLMYTIPKRCFQGGEPQMEEFRQLLREQLAERAKF
jgi:hypothetical protein